MVSANAGTTAKTAVVLHNGSGVVSVIPEFPAGVTQPVAAQVKATSSKPASPPILKLQPASAIDAKAKKVLPAK